MEKKFLVDFRKDSYNFADFLTSRQLGFTHSTRFESETLSMKVVKMENIQEKIIKPARGSNKPRKFKILKGGKESIYYTWDVWGSAVSEFSHLLSPTNFSRTFTNPMHFNLVDFCEFNSSTRLLICIFHLFGLVNAQVFYPLVGGTLHYVRNVYGGCCISTNSFANRYASGCTKHVNLYAVEDVANNHHICTIDMPGRVNSTHFDRTGRLLYCCLSTGILAGIDTRMQQIISRANLCDKGLKELKVLYDGNYVIVSGVPDMMCKVDMRMRRKVFDYESYNQDILKIPFSISEGRDLLCATGADHVTHMWRISNGETLLTWKGKDPSSQSRSWLVNDDANCYFYAFENNRLTVFKI